MRVDLVAAIGDRRRNLTVLLALEPRRRVATTAAAPARAGAATQPAPVLAQGAGMGAKPSVAVRRVQRVLHSRGYSLGRPGVDGRRPTDRAATRRFQADGGLAADGSVGPKTRGRHRYERRRQTPSSSSRTGSRTKKSTPKLVTHEPAGHERRADEQGGQQSEHRCRLACRHRAGSRRGRVLRRHRRQRPATPPAPQPNWWPDRRAARTGLYLEGRSAEMPWRTFAAMRSPPA